MSAWDDFKETKFGKLCTDPAVAFFVGVLGIVIGAGVSFYFYKISTKTRDLSYYVNPNITTIVQPNTNSDLAVTFRGQKITNGFYGQQIAIWNEGKEAIVNDDVLQDVVISVPEGVDVRQVTVAKRSRDLTGFDFASNTNSKTIGLKWKILEYRDGGVVQIFYTGTSDKAFTVEGALRDQPKVREWHVAVAIKNKHDQMHDAAFLVVALIFVGFSYVASLRSVNSMVKKNRGRPYTLAMFGYSLITMAALGSVVYISYLLTSSLFQQTVPFGL